MPGTTRYSATFDRTYEEEDRVPSDPAPARRSRSQSWQATSGMPYSPLAGIRSSHRSSSTENNPSKGPEHIPTRTVGKPAVKAHNNPFQFVKVGTCPLYKKAEEQIKKVKEVKKPEVLKEEEEEWQSNLDSWKSRRRKMSEDVFRRQEEIRQLELEEQVQQANQKKTKTFSEMVESRAHRGRTLSLCLISSPLDLQRWELEESSNKNRSKNNFSAESEGNSTVNSEDEGVSIKERRPNHEQNNTQNTVNSHLTNGDMHVVSSSSETESNRNGYCKFSSLGSDHLPINHKEGIYTDSGLESISSSHRAGDTPDSVSDISQDSRSSVDCESPQISGLNGLNLLENFNAKSLQLSGDDAVQKLKSLGTEITLKLCLNNKNENFGFTCLGGKDEGHVTISAVLEGGIAQVSGVLIGDQILKINGEDIESKKHTEIISLLQKAREKQQVSLVLWRHTKSVNTENKLSQDSSKANDGKYENGVAGIEDRKKVVNGIENSKKSIISENTSKIHQITKYEKSIESENEMFVDDFEELNSKASASNAQKYEAVMSSMTIQEEKKSAIPSASSSCKKIESSSVISSSIDNSSSVKLPESSVNLSVSSNAEKKINLKSNSEEDKAKHPPTKKKVKVVKNSKKKNMNVNQVAASSVNEKENVIRNKNEGSLNIVFETHHVNKNNCDSSIGSGIKSTEVVREIRQVSLKDDILPVEKVAEEMEKLILEQLEEEERAKEMATEVLVKTSSSMPEHILSAPPRQIEPPKEKPPPPPDSEIEVQKPTSLKRVNSTKRIKKEIHKRRSNFLGIENAEENPACGESSVPPPPALEEILKAEMELDRESRKKVESATDERITLEEKEIIEKEREIIETLESEERQKELLNFVADFSHINPSDVPLYNADVESNRIETLKEEKKIIEEEKLLIEEQKLRLLEEKQLREREEYIRKQEDKSCTVQISPPLLSVAENLSNIAKPSITSFSSDANSNISEACGDGKNSLANSASELPEKKTNEIEEKQISGKPVVPPKPLKKKEAIRKERERLRQEQEALQREREEHRRKLIEQEALLKNHSKPHASDVPVSRLGPLPPIVKPNIQPQLTTPFSASPIARENATFASRSHHGAQNEVSVNSSSIEPVCQPGTRQNKMVQPRGKTVQNETWGQQKMPSVKKQNHDSLTESRYNQNHWLIQEAEMRRITELKERQRAAQMPYSQTHLAEDDVCSTSPRVPILPPTPNQHLNYAVQDKMWNYGQSSTAVKKYPPPVSSEKTVPVYPREPIPQPPTKPSRVVPMERQDQMLSVSGRMRCSHCNEELGRGAAMIIESLQLYYHIHCFQCCVCQAQLGNGSCGTDVRVRNNKLHCNNCYSNDEAGLKFSQV